MVQGDDMATKHAASATAALSALLAATGANAAGLPQLDFATFPNQIFWLVVSLLVVFFVLSRVALPRIGSVLATRRGLISSDIAAAEDLKQKAVAAEKAYEQALTDARSEAAKIVAGAKAEIQKDLALATAEADKVLGAKAAEAEGRIAVIRDSAVASVTEVARDTAEALVAALGGKADAATVSAAVMARLKG